MSTSGKRKLFTLVILVCLVPASYSSIAVSHNAESGSHAYPSPFPFQRNNGLTAYGYPPVNYSITFVQSGLPKGTTWSVNLIGTNETTNSSLIVFYRPNGVYNYTVGQMAEYDVSPSHGTIIVNGTNESVDLAFVTKGYDVVFKEEGLPTGTRWNVSLNGTTGSSITDEITFVEPDGIYYYSVGLIHNFTLSPFAGLFTISGKSITTTIVFSRLYSVLFHESGLPNGTRWSVAFNGVTKVSSTSNLSLKEVNGTYPYTINVPENFSTYQTTGTIIVNGSGATQYVKFVLFSITLTGLLTPKTASMFLDGQKVATVAGVFTIALTAGQSYEIEVTTPGYENYFYNLTVTTRTNPTVLLNVNLVSLTVIPGFPFSSLLVIAIILAVMVVAVVTLLRSLRRSKKPD